VDDIFVKLLRLLCEAVAVYVLRRRENAPCGRLWLILWAPVAVQRSYSYASRQIVSHHRNIQIYIVFCIIVNICLFHFGINRKAEGAEFCGVCAEL